MNYTVYVSQQCDTSKHLFTAHQKTNACFEVQWVAEHPARAEFDIEHNN